ncbi:hypothetical protein TUM19329_06380 [Legionella antarctica]|uniref:Dot/Icm secretion system substrate n=1 Tax=Legionella antarctica TaxID=2708020 RepID=A0A6F8T282_9GAMM|nr:type IV secretion protein Dot [Legionella antarctica]BCA94277.1 hypothetical protein TUM19329_06380 [Legionella antarctica]
MANLLNSSHEFVTLVTQLHQSPDDYALKQAVVEKLPKMRALAKANPLDLYRLAQIHAPTSPQYKQMMRQAATMGCTNAMLAAAEILVNSKVPADLQTAAHYLSMIARSKDSFIIAQGRTLLESYPQVAALMKADSKSDSYNTNIRFFTQPDRGTQAESCAKQEVEEPSQRFCG